MRSLGTVLLLMCGTVFGCQDVDPETSDATGSNFDRPESVDERNEKTSSADTSQPPNGKSDEATHVVVTASAYYKTGPQQGQPPDGTFEAGTPVALVQETGSYWLVRSVDGIEAYVAADSLKAVKVKEKE